MPTPPSPHRNHPPSLTKIFYGLAAAGGLIFIAVAAIGDPARAWQAYLLNFLFFSAIAQGAVLFSALMYTVKARWSGPLADVAESFAAFFPISLVLFLVLFLGRQYVFPWLHEDLHGKEVWLNLPFLFGRDFIGLCLLYGLGGAFLYHRLYFTLKARGASGTLGRRLLARWEGKPFDERRFAGRTMVLAILYLLAFAIVLSLIGYDLVMAADPHWYSTLFGAYSFIKAVYIGFGRSSSPAPCCTSATTTTTGSKRASSMTSANSFSPSAWCGPTFFYAQFVVIWYGNIPEETSLHHRAHHGGTLGQTGMDHLHRLFRRPVSDPDQPQNQNPIPRAMVVDLPGRHGRASGWNTICCSVRPLITACPPPAFGVGGNCRGRGIFRFAGRGRYRLFQAVSGVNPGWRMPADRRKMFKSNGQ